MDEGIHGTPHARHNAAVQAIKQLKHTGEFALPYPEKDDKTSSSNENKYPCNKIPNGMKKDKKYKKNNSSYYFCSCGNIKSFCDI